MALLAAAGVFLLSAAFALTPLESHDLWWHLRAGEWVLQTGHPPTRNLFSFTAPDYPWVAHEWLSEALLFWVYSRMGPAALVALKALLVGSTFTLVALTAWRQSQSLWAAAITAVLAAWSARFTFDIRPQLITYLLLAVTLAMVYRHQRVGDRWIYALVPLFCLWANLHSGFLAGLVVLALAGATIPARSRDFVLVVALATAAALLTPYHWRGLWFPLDVSRTRLFTDTLTEWFSPDFHSAWLSGFEVLLLGCLALLAAAPTRPTLFELGLLLGLGHLSLQHQRHVPLFALAAAPILARHLAALAAPLAARVSPSPRASLAAALVGVTAAAGVLWHRLPRDDAFGTMTRRSTFPVAAAAYLQRQPPLRIYNSYVWGGYLIRACPTQPVFIDGRADAYPHQVLADYLNIERLQPGWERLLVNYRINAVVYQRGAPFAAALRRSPDWRVAYSDAVAEVFLRRMSTRGSTQGFGIGGP